MGRGTCMPAKYLRGLRIGRRALDECQGTQQSAKKSIKGHGRAPASAIRPLQCQG